jgi:hypothetical protein
MTNTPTPRLTVDNTATVTRINSAILEKRGAMTIITIPSGISSSAYRHHAAAPQSGLSFERRANESWEQFHGRVFQTARANGVCILTFGSFPNISHETELALIDKAGGLRDGQRIVVPLGE